MRFALPANQDCPTAGEYTHRAWLKMPRAIQSRLAPPMLLRYMTQFECRAESLQRIVPGPEFMPDVKLVTAPGNRAADAPIVQLLRIVELVSSGVARRVEVPDPRKGFMVRPPSFVP
jgi:hypothetical protein